MNRAAHRFLSALALTCISSLVPLPAQTWNRGAYGFGWASAGIYAISATNPRDIVVGGNFTAAPGVTTPNIARWNGSAWLALGAGSQSTVLHLARRANGNVIALEASGQVREWNGAAWTNLGAPLTGGAFRDLQVLSNGSIAVALAVNVVGTPGLLIFQAGVWRPFGATASAAEILDVVHAIQEPTPGTLVAAGNFTLPAAAGGTAVNLATWNGVQWTPLATVGVTPRIYDEFRVFRNGDYVVSSHEPNNGRAILRRSAAGWKTVAKPDNSVRNLAELPNGDILIVGDFANVDGAPAFGVARISDLLPLHFTTLNQAALCAQDLGDGTLVLGGVFTTVNGLPASNFESFGPAVAPSVASLGGGCSGSTLRATNPPFVGATFTAVATNMPTGFALEVWGAAALAPSVPIGPLFGGPANGCNLGVNPVIVQAYAPTVAGSLSVAFTIGNDPAFVGAGWYHQVFGFGAGNVAVATNVNFVRLGAF